MPPGSHESLPPSNAKPYSPSLHLGNGVGCDNKISSLGTMSDTDSSPAPKHFKKRFLQQSTGGSSSSSSVSPGHTPPSPSPVSSSSLSSAAVSPEAAACQALIELSRTESRSSSEGSERRGSSPNDSSQPLQTLREAVWSKVATTLLKQEEDKLVEPPKEDSPMNLSQQCTIRGQQIIEHIIENILDKPMEGGQGTPCEPINVSVNNNQEEGIKASIYESLKNDLLKGKTPLMMTGCSSKSAPTTPPGHNSSITPPAPNTNSVALVVNQNSKMPIQKVAVTTVSPSSAQSSPASISPQHQDVLRLLAKNSQLPINVGNSAITITKTPRPVSQVTSGGQSSSSVTSPAPVLPSPAPVSVSLTRTSHNNTSTQQQQQQQQVFNLNPGASAAAAVPVVLSSQPGVMLSSNTPQGSVVLTNLPPGVAGVAGHGQGSECVLLSAAAISSASQGVILQQPAQVLQLAPAMGQPLLIAAGSKLILAPSVPAQPSNHRIVETVVSSAASLSVVTHDNSHPVNLTVSKQNKSDLSSPPAQPQLAVKRPIHPADDDDDDIRRSSRPSKGKKYQEYVDGGRVGIKTKRRSHKSGGGGEDLSNISAGESRAQLSDTSSLSEQASAVGSNQINHWKKKLRTLGETSGGQSTSATLTANITASQQHYQQQQQHSADTERHAAILSRTTRHPSEKILSNGTRQNFDEAVKIGTKKFRGDKH